ncbi:MAG: folate family ECF transporter S component [Firmicutes bacterium]|nr:folate family ECF transporter S component [Bacillota bacterium]
MSPVLKITTAAMLMCLAIIFTRLIVIDIPPFIRIGIGAVPVIFASVILGPIYGGVIGALSDILGFFLFPHTAAIYTPFVTISGILLGVIPYFIFALTKKLRYQKKPWPLSYLLMTTVWVFLFIYVMTTGQVTIRLDENTSITYVFDIYWKVLTPIITAIIFGFAPRNRGEYRVGKCLEIRFFPC